MCPQLVVKTKYIDTLIKLLLYFTLLYFPTNFRSVFFTPYKHCNFTEPYCGTITGPGLLSVKFETGTKGLIFFKTSIYHMVFF